MLISIDHGNKQVKTIHHAPFTSGLVCSEVRPFGGETLTYQGKYYTLTDQRIPYRRDSTEDERFFVLTLFAIAYELEAAVLLRSSAQCGCSLRSACRRRITVRSRNGLQNIF